LSRITPEELYSTATSGDRFLDLISGVDALSRTAERPGEAIRFFHKSRERLDEEIQSYYSTKKNSAKLEEISARHALLALILWLYPNHPGFNRIRNAVKMYHHAAATQATSRSKADFSYAVGLMVELRITPFLVKSKKKTVEDLKQARGRAEKFLCSFEAKSQSELASIVSDGAGFSYFLFERDLGAALKYLKDAEKNLSSERSDSGSRFLRSIGSVLEWDLGVCYEGMAEGTEGDQMVELLREARMHFQKSRDLAMDSPWHIYRAMSSYSLSGTFYREAAIEIERDKAKELLELSVKVGEDALKWFNLWSNFDGDFLGGSWIASFYQHLAGYTDDLSSKQKLMERSVELAKKAEVLVNDRKVGLSRYRAVNIGDVFFRNAEYFRQLAVETRFAENSDDKVVLELLHRSFADCTKSRSFFRDRAFASRKINSTLLAGDICYDMLSSASLGSEEISNFASKSKRYFREAAKVSKAMGLSETLGSSHWRVAQLFDREGRFAQSASEYEKARQAFSDLVRHSLVHSKLYEETSRYMQAWHDIETAKSAHFSSDFGRASRLYREASNLIASTKRWSSRSRLYEAESLIEEAERKSSAENGSEAIDLFSKAKHDLTILESELSTENSIEAKSFAMLGRQLSSFCDARIILEGSRKEFRIGNFQSSVEGLSKAEIIFDGLSQNLSFTDPPQANELESLSSLCNALKNLQMAQIDNNADLIGKAAEIFASSSEKSTSDYLRPLLKGLSSFATFLHSSKLVESSLDSSLDVERFTECSNALESSERILARLGNRSFLAMLRASKHILDATIKINAAEREVEDNQLKVRLYSQAQRSISMATKYYQELGASEKVQETLRLLSTVKQGRELIPLANQMFAEVASNQIIYSAVSASSIFRVSPENSARQIDSSYLVLEVTLGQQLISPGEIVPISFVVSNFGKEPATVLEIQEALPEGFELATIPSEIKAKLEDRTMHVKLKIDAGQSQKIALTFKAAEHGDFVWHPLGIYSDSQGMHKATRPETARLVVESTDFRIIVEDLRTKKEDFEQKLNENLPDEEKISLRERLSKVEEEIHRFENEYENLVSQLNQVSQDLNALNTINDESLMRNEKIRLESDKQILKERIERRRGLFRP
jgi:hypothetical protein